MSTKAGTIQGTQTGVSWAGGWVAAILLTIVLVVALFAVTRGSGTVEKVPASTRFETTDQLSGGRNVAGATSGARSGGQLVMIGSYACHQCR